MSKATFEIEDMAEAAHQVWMEGKLRDGWTYAPVTDKVAKQHSCLVPYAELSEADKDSDRDLVKGIPDILAKAGYVLKRATE
jgi:RyR domain-containing protein